MNHFEKKELKIYESVPFGILLSLVGGFLDAYTYIGRHGVFANAQTGNIVLLGIRISDGQWKQALVYVPPIFAFILGVVFVEMIKASTSRILMLHWARVVLILEIIILFALGFIPTNFPDMIVTVIISFVASVQVCSFSKLVGASYATTMMTGNLRSFSQEIYNAVKCKNRNSAILATRYLIIIFAFIFGAIAGGILTWTVGVKAIWGSVIILMIPFLFISFTGQNEKNYN